MTLRLDILPPPQRRIWPELADVPSRFVLYGGTAIALRLGHRQSIDFDFFSGETVDGDALLSSTAVLKGTQVIQLEPNALSVIAERGGPVKLSFFGGLKFGRVGQPETATDNRLKLASKLDLFGHKLKVMLQRVEAKDYRDVAALLRSGCRLAEGLGAAMALFKDSFPVSECLKALVYFEGGDLSTLPENDRELLRHSVQSAPKRVLPAALVATTL